ncbi:putative conjugative transfer protein TraC [Vibrio nigripulchritudo MADA3029]|uniref:type IV secretion system protein TraC n=2 Tax=Vibrio nigripulchritudo TaxID=28173 RepID=UPI0003B1E367|nr:putative conjugative transfer protein TraC [Vibrio nigripulchritudo MADA3020]CCN56706.1 putative conjugative transfer protein TraC [Vibrio nigripulchritudo MADA3021]CCN62563.1 putative conjugative transfer protein TraC [Vibrio nigripulchritudo MADA3029]
MEGLTMTDLMHSQGPLGTLSAFFKDAKRHQNHLHQELPYRTFDDTTAFFHNLTSTGMGFKLGVLGGANDEFIHSLNKLVSELPQGDKWDYQLTLFGHHRTAQYIEENEAALSVRGGLCEKLAKQESEYAKYAACQGFFHRQSHRFDLRDYDAYFFVSTVEQDDDRLSDVRAAIETTFAQLGVSIERINGERLLTIVKDVLNFDPAQDRPKTSAYNPYEWLNQQTLSPDTELLFHRGFSDIRHTSEEGYEVSTRLVNLGLTSTPDDFRLYALPECLASVRNVARHLTCPHMLSLNFRQKITGKVESENNRKIGDLTKTVSSKLALIMPTAEDELTERRMLQKGLANREFTLSAMSMTLTLFSTSQTHRRDTQAAKEAFSASGIDIKVQSMMQSQCLLSVLPFMMSEGFWSDSQIAGRVKTVKSLNLVNFFPIIMDFKRRGPGVLLPTMRGQISYFDAFSCGSDNKNIALTGGSGAGKSFVVQQIAKTVYAKGGKVWILDKGKSYKKLTLMLGGAYLDHTRIFLNPFTHLENVNRTKQDASQPYQDDQGTVVDPMKEALSNITALFATIASPYSELSAYQLAVLGDAIVQAWEAKGTVTQVDDVQHALFSLAKDNGDDSRIRDIAVQLNKFCRNGVYGDTFNLPSMLDPDIDITTLELDGFNEDMLRPVMFALIVSINQQMYLSGDRSREKLCIIEEAWSLMSGANAQARTFINTGYRTARKFGGAFCTVTQGMEDFFANAEAKACFDNSDIHLTLRQGEGFETFLTENPNYFSDLEQRVIRSFPRASEAGYSCLRIKAGGVVSFHRVFADPFTRACLSTEPREYEYCESLMSQNTPLMEAIEKTARRFYGRDIADYERHLKAEQEEKAA